jgi:hypothetical protein
MNEALQNIAQLLGKTLSEIGRDLYVIAAFLDEKKNKGLKTYEIDRFAKTELRELPTYFFKPEYEEVYQNVLFFKKSDRWSDNEGWMIRKTPNWRISWRLRWGEYCPEQKALVDQWEAEEAARLAAESQKPKRKETRFHQGDFEQFKTDEIAYRAACMQLLAMRAAYRWQQTHNRQQVEHWRGMHYMYDKQFRIFVDELWYRTMAQPDPAVHKSKKKQKEAVADFAKAQSYFLEAHLGMTFILYDEQITASRTYSIDHIVHQFFTPEFIDQAVKSAEEPDLYVDLEHKPKRPLQSAVVRWLPDHEVIGAFMKFLNEDHDPKSFEYEDKRKILETLRRMYAQAVGQRPFDDLPTISGSNE